MEEKEFIGYLKFFGPSVDEGKIDIEKIGLSLISLNKILKQYAKKKNIKNINLKLGGVKKNCTEVNIFLEQIAPVAEPLITTASILLVAKTIGVTELGKQFFGTIGQQLALKLFSKGEKLKIKKEYIEDGKIFVLLENSKGKEKKVLKEIYDTQKDYSPYFRDFIQLEEQKAEKMQIGYYENSNPKSVSEIEYIQKDFFFTKEEPTFEERLQEDFDESKAENIKLIGKFIDYHGMAQKYHFSFQARKKQEEIGKQKILCKVENSMISSIIDLLKPESQKDNCVVYGKATKNNEGKIDKIIIERFSNDENYNPNQLSL